MPPAAGGDFTLRKAFDAYARNVIAFRGQSPKTEEHHFTAMKSLIDFMGDKYLPELTFEDVRDWKVWLERRGLSPITVRGYMIKLRVVLAYARSLGYEVLDPVQIPLPKRVERVPPVISADQVRLLIDSTNKPRNKAIISLLYSSGLRVSELCSLNRSDIADDHFTITGKGGKSRLCFIDRRTRRLLDAYLRERRDNERCLFISPYRGARMTPGDVQEIFKYARRKAGFDFPVHPHTLRHSFATNLMSNGMHIYTLSRLMGHASIQTTSVYLHITDPQLQDEYKKYHSV